MPKLARTVLAFAVAFAIVAATVVGVSAAGYVVRSPIAAKHHADLGPCDHGYVGPILCVGGPVYHNP